jgi:hypothetical protein
LAGRDLVPVNHAKVREFREFRESEFERVSGVLAEFESPFIDFQGFDPVLKSRGRYAKLTAAPDGPEI